MINTNTIFIPRASRTCPYDIILAFPTGSRFVELRRQPPDSLWQNVEELKGVIYALKQSQDPHTILVEDLAHFLEHKYDDLREAIAVRSDMTWVSELTPEALAAIARDQPEKANWLDQNWAIIEKDTPGPSRDWVRPAFYAVALAVAGLFLWRSRYNLFAWLNQRQAELVELLKWHVSQIGNLWIGVLASLVAAVVVALIGRLWDLRRRAGKPSE